jgi:hypothetical protein
MLHEHPTFDSYGISECKTLKLGALCIFGRKVCNLECALPCAEAILSIMANRLLKSFVPDSKREE